VDEPGARVPSHEKGVQAGDRRADQKVTDVRNPQRLAALALNALTASIAIVGEDGTVLEVNEAWRAFTAANGGSAFATGKGANYLAVCDAAEGAEANDARAFADGLRAVLRGERSRFGMEYPCHSPREEHWFSGQVMPLPGESPAMAVVVHEEITDRKRAEEALHASQKLEALGTMAGGIAHDFNNLLFAILGNAHLAVEELPEGHVVHERIAEIEKASRRATDLVKRILAFSQPQSTARTVVPLEGVVEEALRLVRATLPAGIAIQSSFPPLLPLVACDVWAVEQIVVNLATNASHAIGSHPGRIGVSLDETTADEAGLASLVDSAAGRFVRLTFSDDGSGMTPGTLRRAFDPFFTTKPTGSGTGLGLSVIHGIMKSHGGAATVESAPGKGATFRLYFPVASATPSPAVERGKAPEGRGERILYVDDEESLVLLLERFLVRCGYAVTGETDPAKALALFRADPDAFDAVVTDLAMPGMSGFDLVREIRAIRSSVPIVLTSGYVTPEDEAAAREAGNLELVLKPGTVEEFGAVLHAVLRGRNGST
jgi:signal transduction histidine kinase/CheY-like chemotaxis protein